MTTHQGIRVSSSTSGSPSPGFEEQSGGYRWRGIENWTGGNIPEVLEETPAPFAAGGEAIREIRVGRIATFGDALRDLGHDDPATASLAAVIEAGKRVGVGERTAKRYRAALLKQQRGESRDA